MVINLLEYCEENQESCSNCKIGKLFNITEDCNLFQLLDKLPEVQRILLDS